MTLNDRVARFLRANRGKWIPAIAFERVGGRQAWRTRLSNLRQRGMEIENRQTRVRRRDGSLFIRSEYCFTGDRV